MAARLLHRTLGIRHVYSEDLSVVPPRFVSGARVPVLISMFEGGIGFCGSAGFGDVCC